MELVVVSMCGIGLVIDSGGSNQASFGQKIELYASNAANLPCEGA